MSLTPRKRVAKHVHSKEDVVESAKYEVLRPVAKLIPSSEIVLRSTEEATTYLDNWQDADSPQLVDGNQTTAQMPLTSQAENFVANASFEEDRNGDGIPDYWTYWVEAGAPSKELTDLHSWKGTRSFRISCQAGEIAYLASTLIPVEPNKDYFLAVDIYANATATFASSCWYVQFLGADKVTDVGSFYVDNPSSISAGWNHKTGKGTSPDNARWAKVFLRNHNPSGSVSLFFDNAVLSEMRAAVPTAGVVAAGTAVVGGLGIATTQNAWTNDIRQITVPNEDHDTLFVQASFSWDYGHYFKYRIYNMTKQEYYPSDDPSKCPFVMCWGSGAATTADITALMVIPKNIKGDTLRLDVYRTTADKDRNFVAGALSVWGSSPHTHR